MKKLILILSLAFSYCHAEPQVKQGDLATEAVFYSADLSKLTVEVSAGELIDKLTILEIKLERINDPKKLENIQNEMRAIMDTVAAYIPPSTELTQLAEQLKQVNEKLWVIEDDIREKEVKKEFDQEFIALSRSVYYTNDQRGYVKRQINELLGSRLMEEKQYTRYDNHEE